MKPFNEYISAEEIINQLCKDRIKIAEHRNDKLYVGRLAGNQRMNQRGEVDDLLPPRRSWAGFRPKHRSRVANPDLNSLLHATLSLRQTQPDAAWVQNLNAFIQEVQERVLGNQPFRFTPPTIKWQPKEPPAENKYRALSPFTLQDNLINCLAEKYLRDLFDPVFETSSFAFRGRGADGRTPTYHSAFETLYQHRIRAKGQDLYVAECDIRGFYDTVNHGVALDALNKAASSLTTKCHGQSLNSRAKDIFRAYLDCYTYPRNVLDEATPRLRDKTRNADSHFPWPNEALRKHYANPESEAIGVPQGGAISGVIANLVLDLADKKVEVVKQELGLDVLYMRYCDDMIVVADLKSECEQVFEVYLEALDSLKLPYHTPEKTHIYDRDHWNHKSKAPYCWSGRQWFGCVPWVQFMGYQTRYDGLVRVRIGAVQKQQKAMREVTDKVKFDLLRHGERGFQVQATKDQALESVRHKMIAKGVGRVEGARVGDGPKPMCWASGFKALHNKPIVPTFLKALDRARERQVCRFLRANIQYGPGRTARNVGRGRRQHPVGRAYSYVGQFKNNGGWDLILNPWRGAWWERWLSEPLYKWIIYMSANCMNVVELQLYNYAFVKTRRQRGIGIKRFLRKLKYRFTGRFFMLV